MKKLLCLITLIGGITPSLINTIISNNSSINQINKNSNINITEKKWLDSKYTWFKYETLGYTDLCTEINMTANGIHDFGEMKENYSRIGFSNYKFKFFFLGDKFYDLETYNDWWTCPTMLWGASGWIWKNRYVTEHKIRYDIYWQTIPYADKYGNFWLSLQYSVNPYLLNFIPTWNASFDGIWIE